VIAVIDRVSSGVLTSEGGVASLVESLGMRREAATSIMAGVVVQPEPVANPAPDVEDDAVPQARALAVVAP
jgi:hypothetical protein